MRLDSFFSGALCVLSGGRLPEAFFMVFLLDSKGAEVCSTERALVALNGFQAELAQLRAAGLPTMVAQALHRMYVNGAVTHLLRGRLVEAAWCDQWDQSVEGFWASLVGVQEFSATQRLQLHLPLSSEY